MVVLVSLILMMAFFTVGCKIDDDDDEDAPSPTSYTIMIAEGIEHGSVSASPTAAAGASVTLTVTPADGYKLNTISVKDANSADVTITQDTSNKSKYTFTMPESNVTVSATFTESEPLPPASYTITVADSIEHGSVTASPTTASAGASITLTVTPADGYELVTISVKDANNAAVQVTKDSNDSSKYTFTMPESNVTVSAVFVEESAATYTITIAEGIEHGSVSASPTTAAAGASVTLTVTPADGYELDTISVRDANSAAVTVTQDSSDTSKYTFTMPASNVTVSAVFVEESAATYTITIADSIEHGSVSASPTTAAAGTSVTLTVTPADGYKLNTISVKDVNSADVTVSQDTSDKSKYTFTMPESNVTVSATFAEDTSKIPLTLEFIAAGSITITNPWSTLKYTVNDGTLTDYSAAITVANGDKVCFYAESSESSNYSGPDKIPMTIGCDADCYVYGNIMSLVTHTGNGSWDKTATELTDEDAFRRLFKANTHIKNHASKDLVLPATTLSKNCYDDMFDGCTGLTELPEDMLPATTLANFCYSCMFYGCTNLVKAPALPASTLAPGCYSDMFHNCSSLNAITCLATDISANYCTDNWVEGVAASGTFTTPSSTNWGTGVDGIPSGWEVVNASN